MSFGSSPGNLRESPNCSHEIEKIKKRRNNDMF